MLPSSESDPAQTREGSRTGVETAPAHARVPTDADTDARLQRLLAESVEVIDRILRLERGLDPGAGGYSQSYRGQLAILRALLGMRDGVLAPEPDPRAALGWRFPRIETELQLEPGGGFEVLEELADLGLLKRKLAGHVHVCSKCRHFHLNYRETCPGCGSVDNSIERLLHHFHCAYTGLEGEFQQGIELVCPRCRCKLFQLGQDFDCPHDTYVCRDCTRIFEEPALRALCLVCAHDAPARETTLVRFHDYRATPLTVRAVELNRLTGLDVSDIMFDTRVRLATPDFLEFEVERERHRVRRYGGAFTLVRLGFDLVSGAFALFREWDSAAIVELSRLLTSTLRPLDLVARLDGQALALFLPETDAQGVQAVEKRLKALLAEAALSTREGRPLGVRWESRSFAGADVRMEDVREFLARGEVRE